MLRLDGIVFTIINLIVLYLILRHFLIGPIRNIMQKRDEMLAKQFADAKAKEEQAAEMKMQYEALMHDAKEESNRILENAKQEPTVNMRKDWIRQRKKQIKWCKEQMWLQVRKKKKCLVMCSRRSVHWR